MVIRARWRSFVGSEKAVILNKSLQNLICKEVNINTARQMSAVVPGGQTIPSSERAGFQAFIDEACK